jgi:hypothetical protein
MSLFILAGVAGLLHLIMRATSSLALLLLAVGSLAAAQETLDGRDHPLQDPFLDGLVGDWQVARVMKDRTAQNTVQAEWVLNHQFLRLHYRDVATPSKYEAIISELKRLRAFVMDKPDAVWIAERVDSIVAALETTDPAEYEYDFG